MTPEELRAHVQKNCECHKPEQRLGVCSFCAKLCECWSAYYYEQGELCWYCRWRLKVDA